jgi:MFS family permease
MSQAHPKSPAAQPPARNRRDAILVLLSFAMLLVSLDQYIVVVALPEIARDLGYSAQTLQSVVSAYAIASSGFLLFGGRASDLLGRRRVLVVGLFLYFAASLAAASRPTPRNSLLLVRCRGLAGPWCSQARLPSSTFDFLKEQSETGHSAYGRAPGQLAW